jgi:cytochrome c553
MADLIRRVTIWLLVSVSLPAAAAGASHELLARADKLSGDAEHGHILFLKHCAKCHSPHGWGDGPRAIPALAGQREHYLLQQLARFATGERPDPVMHENVQPPDLNRAQAMRDLAAYLSQASRDQHVERGEGRALVAGGRLFADSCLACHGSAGEGNETAPVPAIGGQHYRYLLSRLQRFTECHAPDTAGATLAVMAHLSAAERSSLADYISHLDFLTAATH